MNLSITEKGKRVVKLIKAVQAARVLLPGGKVRMPGEGPAAYIGPALEDRLQVHEFRLFDGTDVALEVPALDQEPGAFALLAVCETSGPVSR